MLGWHESSVQTLPSSQLTAVPPHAPPEHTSLPVQASPSLHATLLFVCVQPVPGSQASVVQRLPSSQLGAAPPTHTPPEQVSFVVQALLSLHEMVLFVCVQPLAGLQLSPVQKLPSSQLGGGPPTQAPPAHVSLVVQASPSLHAALLFVNTQPVAGAQVSFVHTLLSLQTSAGPPAHVPPEHVSLVVQASPSLQTADVVASTGPA